MEPLNIGIVGTGWCGGIRAVAAAESPLVGALHLAEINPERLAEVRGADQPRHRHARTGRSWSPIRRSRP